MFRNIYVFLVAPTLLQAAFFPVFAQSAVEPIVVETIDESDPIYNCRYEAPAAGDGKQALTNGSPVLDIDTGVIFSGARDDTAYALTEALFSEEKRYEGSYRLSNIIDFSKRLEVFFACSPVSNADNEDFVGGITMPANPPNYLSDAVAGFEACADDPEPDSWELIDSECFSRYGVLDYENVIADPYASSVSKDLASHLSREFSAASTAEIELALNVILERVRLSLAKESDPSKEALRPASVKVVTTGQKSIRASPSAMEVRISQEAIKDIYIRAFHRASYSGRLLFGTDFLEDCDICDIHTSFGGAFATTLERYLFLRRALPGLKAYQIDSLRLADAIRKGCVADDLASFGGQVPQVADYVSRLRDIRQQLTKERIREVAACADFDGKLIPKDDLDLFIGEAESLLELEESGEFFDNLGANSDEYMFAYVPLMMEATIIDSAFAAEIAKSFVFILAHEGYHLWISPLPGQSAEYAADLKAVEVYLDLFNEFPVDAWFDDKTEESASYFQSAFDTKQVFQSVVGREPNLLLQELFEGTAYEGGTWSHPPLSNRIEAINNAISGGRLQQMCDQLQVAQGSIRKLGLAEIFAIQRCE